MGLGKYLLTISRANLSYWYPSAMDMILSGITDSHPLLFLVTFQVQLFQNPMESHSICLCSIGLVGKHDVDGKHYRNPLQKYDNQIKIPWFSSSGGWTQYHCMTCRFIVIFTFLKVLRDILEVGLGNRKWVAH